MKATLFQKLTSRKFILAALTALTGVCTLLFGENAAVQTVMGALMVILPAIVYCITEGKIDAASISQISGAITDAAEKLGASEHTLEGLSKINDAASAITESMASIEK